MFRILAAVVAAATLTAAAPQAPRDWRTAAVLTPAGSVTVGNPAARVKLVEYLSFTCPHCGHLVTESKAGLHDDLVRSGRVSVETRAAVRDPYDLAAWSLVRCGGPARFTALTSAVFAGQDAWMKAGSDYATANLPKLRAMQQPAQIRAILDNSGLARIGAAAGVTPAALGTCLADGTQTKQLVAMTEAAFAKIAGTPAVEVNGDLIEGATWATLEPRVRAAAAAR